jgi:hypothetical protein
VVDLIKKIVWLNYNLGKGNIPSLHFQHRKKPLF